MNRKEFKNLLTEWNQNFINERGKNEKFHSDLEKSSGWLVNPSSEEITGILDFIKDKIEENEVESIKDVAYQEYIDFGLVLPKNNEVIDMISDFFIFSGNEEKSSEVLNVSSNDECVIIHFTEGDFTQNLSDQDESLIYSWTLHDMEHTLFSGISSQELYFSNASLNIINKNLENLDKPHEKVNNNNISVHEILKKGTIAISAGSSLIKKFFEEINFTPTADMNDLHASIMSYCYIKNIETIKQEINNLSYKFSKEEKAVLQKTFTDSYYFVFKMFNELKRVFNNCIIIITNA
jgi:hypothetical protein